MKKRAAELGVGKGVPGLENRETWGTQRKIHPDKPSSAKPGIIHQTRIVPTGLPTA
jgi:hypothetical protein